MQSSTHPRHHASDTQSRPASCLVAFLSVIPAGNLLLSFSRQVPKSPALKFLLLLLALAIPSPAQTAATSIPLLLPTTIAFDPSGNLYIAETNRHVIDRIDSSGTLTVVAGNGTQGFSGDSGPARAAQLDSPQGLAADASGNLYLADTHNHRIRRVDAATGLITTIAGSGSPGFSGDGAAASAAQLALPTALALDSSGNLDIADTNNHRIRQLNLSTGSLRTIAGNGIQANSGDNGPALGASIDTPTGLAVDRSNNLYLADTHNHRIRRVDAATALITTLAGADPNQPGLLLPRGLSLDSSGTLYVADTNAHRILQITPAGAISTIAGQGTQGFAGDGGPALAALLDSPRSAAVSPLGLVTLADTANQRVRQIDSSQIIHTLSGIGTPTQTPSAALTLIAPATTQYGTGSLTAIFTSATPATAPIALLESSGNLLTTLATIPLASNTATFSLAHLPAGPHQILSTYPGDPTHPSLQSSTILLTITPAPVIATPNPATAVYGQPIPTLTGTLTGILPQDATLVSALFSTPAKALSPAATYPIAVTLVGPSAPNYQVTSTTPATLTIAQAPTATALTATAQGTAVMLAARTLSTTKSTPTGRLAFLDATTTLASAPLDPSGAASLPATLTPGTHTLTAVYSGDTNFLPSASPAVTQSVLTTTPTAPGSSPDFTLTPATASQTATSGASVTYPFTVAIQNGPLNSPILLAAAGMPLGATASFTPTLLPPGTTTSSFTLTIQTPKTTARRSPSPHPLLAFLIAGCVALLPARRKATRPVIFLAVFAVVAVVSLSGCGDRISAIPQIKSTTTVYPMTVTATSTTATGAVLQHTAAITLTLQ